MPHKKRKGTIQVFGEVFDIQHNKLKEYKKRYGVSIYHLVGMCIEWSCFSPDFEEWLDNIFIRKHNHTQP